ncbi:MAG TPA: hypothetical protein VE779_08515 [Candidatus Angelobacter sp.]|nr:hypothetical protein [Candidatus Angelobacter sp.]
MERRYLVATLALAATFAMFSGEFCTRNLSKVPHSKAELKADIACARSYVAKQLLAKLEPYVGRSESSPEPRLAELNVPEIPQAPEAAAAVAPARPSCPAAVRGKRSPQSIIQMRVMASGVGRGLTDPSVMRAELLSERAQELQETAKERAIEINVRAMEVAQRNSQRAMEQAQRNSQHAMEQARRDIEKSRVKVVVSGTTGSAMHINFVGPTITMSPAAPPTPTLATF